MSHCVEPCGGPIGPGYGAGCNVWSNTGTILVLFILLVIIVRAFCF